MSLSQEGQGAAYRRASEKDLKTICAHIETSLAAPATAAARLQRHSASIWRCSCLVRSWLMEMISTLHSRDPSPFDSALFGTGEQSELQQRCEAIALQLPVSSITLALIEQWREHGLEMGIGRRVLASAMPGHVR